MPKLLKNKEVEKKVRDVAKPSKVLKVKKSPFRPDTNQSKVLLRAGRLATKKAVRVSKALGLEITYMENGVLYRETANGQREVLVKAKANKEPQRLKKGIILHAR